MPTGDKRPSWLKVGGDSKEVIGVDNSLYDLWNLAVRNATGSEDYTLRRSAKSDKIFAQCRTFLRGRNDLDRMAEFMAFTVDTCVQSNRTIWPTILISKEAQSCWGNLPSADERLRELRTRTEGQARLFKNLVTRYGEDFPYESPMVTMSHIFLAYMKHATDKDIPEDLLEDAKADLLREPLNDRIYPVDFIGRLR